MMQLPEGFDSIFRYITVVSQRAEQLINGAKLRSDSKSVKRTMQAKDDVDEGLVAWRVLTQEELDAQRQAIVDQFRAEVGSDEYASAMAPVPDVLPTTAEAASQPEPEAGEEAVEQDDELARLRHLLGLAGGTESVADDENDDEVEAAADDEDEDIEAEVSLDSDEEMAGEFPGEEDDDLTDEDE